MPNRVAFRLFPTHAKAPQNTPIEKIFAPIRAEIRRKLQTPVYNTIFIRKKTNSLKSKKL